MKKLFIISFLMVLFTSCDQKKPLFTTVTGEHSGITFTNQITETDSFNINNYLYAYNGGGIAIGDVNNDGLSDIYLTANQSSNHLYINQGNLEFEDVTNVAGVGGPVENSWSTGVTMVDINHDGWLDIYVNQVSGLAHLAGHNLLYINNQDGTFTEKAGKYGLDFRSYAQQTAFFDYDLDGDLDAYLMNHSIHELDVYINANQRNREDTLAGDRLLRNDNGFFIDVTKEAGIYNSPMGYGLGIHVADLDNNGCPDIYVSNDFHENDYLYFNQCDGTFKEQIKEAMDYCSSFSMGNDIADINNDGQMDIMTLDMKPQDEVVRKQSTGTDPYDIFQYKLSFGYLEQYPRNMLQINQGQGTFNEIAQLSGIEATDWSWSVLMEDFDNDGWKDIFITNGIYRRPNDMDYINYTYHEGQKRKVSPLELVELMPEGKVSNYAYKNLGNLHFEDVSADWGLDLLGYSMGSAYGDLDNDGDLDLVVNNLNNLASLYQNNTKQSSNHHFLDIKLNGPPKNPNGIGARVSLFFGDSMKVAELNPVTGWLSSSDHKLHFGLGKNSRIDSIMIKWPGGNIQKIFDFNIDQLNTITYDHTAEKKNRSEIIPTLFSEVEDTKGLEFLHLENKYTDFTNEKLIPYELSKEGPAMATGDLNGDGLEDLYLGGASGQSGKIFLQQSDQQGFVEVNVDIFEMDKGKEDVDAAIFDADGDGDMDLFVVSGGNQFRDSPVNEDRLYLNQGNGHWTKSKELPRIYSNGSCVVTGDFNRDGSIDLFIGNRSIPGNYGYAPDAYILWNNGQGQYKMNEDPSSVLHQLGMVTGADWDESSQQLVIVGEWMPITILSFSDNQIISTEIPESSGWWQTIYGADLDDDGDKDYLLGNFGMNSPLKPTTEHPVKLILNDWDQNGQPEPILTYFRQGKEWLFNSLDEISKQLPIIRVKYPTYDKYAEHTVEEFFSQVNLKNALTLKASSFESSILISNGDGSYHLTPLPYACQSAPINTFLVEDFDGDAIKDILAFGNQAGINPSIGNQMASSGHYLLGKKDMEYQYVSPLKSGLNEKGVVRKILPLQVNGEQWLVLARNNASVKLWKKNISHTHPK